MSDPTSATADTVGASPIVPIDSQTLLQAAMAAGLPRFYANGLGLAGTATDVIMVLFHNGQPVCAINLAFPTAKGLVEDLTVALNDIEAALNQPIKTPRETAEGIQRLRQAAEKKP